nr:sec-independent protein translocase protein TatC-like [Nerophis lumbriciformis]
MVCPRSARTLGKGLGEFRRATNELKRTLDAEMIEEELRKSDPRRILKDRDRQAATGQRAYRHGGRLTYSCGYGRSGCRVSSHRARFGRRQDFVREQLPPAGGSEPDAEELSRMGLLDHLDELRKRLLYAALAFIVTFLACWSFHRQIYDFLAQPIYRILDGKKLVAALAGIFLASPIILYQLWAFVAPGLYRRERRMAGPFIFFGSVLFLAGGAFAYYVAFPFAVEFLVGMGEDFEASITVSSYLGFLMTVILGLGVMFELPTLIFLLAKIGVVTPRFLLRHFRWAVVIIFVVAAVITPTPDVVNLCVFALPTIVLYLVGVAVAWTVTPDKRRQKDGGEDEGERED